MNMFGFLNTGQQPVEAQPGMQVPGMVDPNMAACQQGMGYPAGGAYPAGVGYPQGGVPMQQPGYAAYQQGGYGQYPVGRVDRMGFVHYTRQQMLEGLRNYVIMANQGRVPITKEEKVEETPQFLRHACAECGVSYLQLLQFNIPEVGVSIPFYFCTACGKLFYYKDFYQ